jgi:hypothetical protein
VAAPLEHQKPARLQSRVLAFATIATYLAVMAWTNTRFTLIDDEANFIAAAAQPVMPLLQGYFSREGLHDLHPPAVTILLHGWLIATHYSFFALRIFANIFFVVAVYCTTKAAEKAAGKSAYWFTLLIGLAWPFAFQYGRITEWYGCSMFLLSVATWAYMGLLDDRRIGPWFVFGTAGLLLVWCSYFGFVFLFVFLADLLLFHRALALRRMRRVLAIAAVIAAGFLPLLKPSLQNMAESSAPNAFRMSLAHNIASAGYPAFSIFGSVAVAPWFWPLSIPVFSAIILLVLSVWPSAGRRWILYFAFTMLVLELSGQMSIKRVVFLLPWLFLSMGLAASTDTARSRLQARLAIGVLLACGWMGIASGRHYATTNLYEPWAEVAKVVASDARSGATIASENPPFFLYLNYHLGLEREVGSTFANLGPEVYRAHGYNVLESYIEPSLSGTLHGKVVLVKGPSVKEEVEAQNALNEALRPRCRVLGEYRAAPDPAARLKARFTENVAVLDYRTDVIWYDCP